MERSAEPEILYEDKSLVVIQKPPGLLCQGDSSGAPDLVNWFRNYWGHEYVGLIHRLDRNTSGLMVIARRTKPARRLTDALQQGKICRKYLAWIEGNPPETFEWKHFLRKDSKSNRVRVFDQKEEGTKEALLHGKRLEQKVYRGDLVSLVELELDTGRGHQIRAQASQLGFPLLGDQKYRSKISFPRPALHSYFLSFPHPIEEKVLEFKVELPADLQLS